jgi:hypothetical protein
MTYVLDVFSPTRYRASMPAPLPQLEPADRDTLLMLLAYALGFTLAGCGFRSKSPTATDLKPPSIPI